GQRHRHHRRRHPPRPRATPRGALARPQLRARHRPRDLPRRAPLPAAGSPAEDRTVKVRVALIAASLLALASLPLWGSAGARSTLIFVSYHAALAQMWNLLAGYAGLVTFGEQLFVGAGGKTVALLCEKMGLGVWPSLALAPLVCGACAVPIGALTFRLRGGYFAVGSWVVAEVVRLLVGNWEYAGFASGLFIRPARRVDPWLVYAVAVGTVVLLVALVVAMLRSRAGLALQAIRDGEHAAASLGVDVWRVKLR